ncbi:MAG TPA: glutathione transferase GstA [Casimicrobiaceae bacterium]|nr:glutathione transferase GstA [Casimicrobiaceae bacterium]
MKLYFSPGACSLAPHIVLHELGLPFTAVKVDLKSHKLDNGADYYTVHPKGYVPVLELDDGTRLSEASVILQYLADRKPGTLAPAFGDLDRYRHMEWLNFIATELHKGFSPLWNADYPQDARRMTLEKLGKRLGYVEETLAKREFIADDRFTVADAYLTTILSWAKFLKIDLSPWPAITQYLDRMAKRPSVVEARRMESAEKTRTQE